jgi:RNA polymerase sigma-70 factor (ECF subfamily)
VDDIAQLSLVEVARSFHNYRGEGALSSWADRITMRVALHYVRRKRSEERRRSTLAPDLHVVSGTDQPDDFTLRRETARLLDELPDDQRQAVVMHHVLGLSMPELANELGIPFETARSRLRLGIQKLRARVLRRGPT